jgi:hypothetical protein
MHTCQELSTQHNAVELQLKEVLKSQMQRTKCVIVESRHLRMFNGGLVRCPMRPRVPFVASRELGAIGAPFGRPLLPSICWRTGLSGAHWTVNSTQTRHNKESPDWLVSSSMGHRTIRCGALDCLVRHVTVGLRPTW